MIYRKGVCPNTQSLLRGNLCPNDKDDDCSDSHSSHNCKGVASPPNGCQELLSSSELEEEVHMVQPPILESSTHCTLKTF